MTVAETVDIVAKVDHMECKQPHYFFIILGEDSWGILIVIPCERMIKGNCITAKVMPDHYMIFLCCQSQQEHLEAASSCFANTENLNEQVLFQCDGIASFGNMQISNSRLFESSKCWVYSAVNHPWWMSMLFH